MIKRAILHVEDTHKLVDFAKYLSSSGWTLLSANKTEEILRTNNIPVQQEPSLVEDNYYASDTFNLIKRLLLTRYNQPSYIENQQEEENNIFILCINVIPTINPNIMAKNQATPLRPMNLYISTILKNAFINYENILILTDPNDYEEAMVQLKTNNITREFRTFLAAKALNLSSAYDGALATSILKSPMFNIPYLSYMTFPFKKYENMKHGANEHQTACIYKAPSQYGLIDNFLKLPENSIIYNLAADIAFAWEQISNLFSILKNQFVIRSQTCDGYDFTTQFTPLTGTVFTMAVKVNSIVGAALSTNVLDSLKKTFTYDSKNIKKAVFASSAVIDEDAANEIVNKCNFIAVIAPGYTPEAKKILAKKEDLKIIPASKPHNLEFDGRLVNGGFLVQQKDSVLFDHWIVKTRKRPNQVQTDEMALGMLLAMGSRSYSAVLIKNNAVVGIAEACPSRVQAIDEVYFNTKKHNKLNENTDSDCDNIADVLVSDTSIPFCDSVKKIIEEGITAIIQTGGEPDDEEFINYCNEKEITMVFTEMSHIRF